MYNLNHLWVFYGVAQVKSVSGAAKKLYLTQSAVSHNLRLLEEDYGVILAERSRRGFRLTPAGEQLFQTCTRIFSDLEKTEEKFKALKAIPQGDVILGTGLVIGFSYFLPHLAKLKKLYPKLNVHLYFAPSAVELATLLKAGEIDVACTDKNFLPATPAIYSYPIPKNAKVYLMGSPLYLKQFPKAKRKEDIFQYTFIDFNKENPLSRWFLDKAAMPSKSFQEYLYVSMGLKEAVLARLGVCCLPRYAMEKELRKQQVELILPKQIAISKQDCLACFESRQNTLNISCLFDYFRGVFES